MGTVDAGWVHLSTNILHSFNRCLSYARHCSNPQDTAVNETNLCPQRTRPPLKSKQLKT